MDKDWVRVKYGVRVHQLVDLLGFGWGYHKPPIPGLWRELAH